jgi:hypothetical protein
MWESNFLNATLEVGKLGAEGRHNNFDSFIYFHNSRLFLKFQTFQGFPNCV